MYHSVIKNKEGKELSSIFNDGSTEYGPENFENSYQNSDGDEGKKSFLMLWLHAYKYSIPNEDEMIEVKSPKPDWACQSWKM